MKTTDNVRGFDWPVEPLRRRLVWRLDGAKLELSRLLQAKREIQGAVDDFSFKRSTQLTAMKTLPGCSMDPLVQQESLRYLNALNAEIQDAERKLVKASQEVEQSRRRLGLLLQKAEALESSRDEAWRQFQMGLERRQSSLQDGELIMRLQWLRAHGKQSELGR